MIRNIFLLSIISLFTINTQAQTKKALFLGNSYTMVNNTPQIVADLASSVFDTLIFDSNTPGGYTFQAHSSNTTSLEKIAQGNWDYVFLQEQSQLPSLPIEQVTELVFPYAHKLDSLIKEANPCTKTSFFMTWGRKNGDSENCSWWPPVCSYEGMDSLLSLRYRMMADSNQAEISPVGALWKYLRENYPAIELYATDESHPSQAGSYAAACCFYTNIFQKDPSLLKYNYNLIPITASIIKQATKAVVYDSLSKWHIGENIHTIGFTYEILDGLEFQFTNLSENSLGQLWDFGFITESESNPFIQFPSEGEYPFTLFSYGLCDTLSISQNLSVYYSITDQYSPHTIVQFYPNPTKGFIYFNIDEAVNINIYDISLKRIFSLENILINKLDISSLSKGIYFVRFNNQNNFQKLIIN